MFLRIWKRYFYKLVFHRPTFLLLILSIVFALFINSTGGIYSRTKLNRMFKELPIETVKISLGIHEDAQPEELIDNYLQEQFSMVFVQTASGLEWVAIVFAAILICGDYEERGLEPLITHGASKRIVFWSKWGSCEFLFWLVSSFVLWIMIALYTTIESQSPGLVLRNYFLFSLIILSFGAECAGVAFICRKTLRSAGIIILLLLAQNIIPIEHPMQLMGRRVLWESSPPAILIKMAITHSASLLIGSVLISRICFEQMELK